MPKRDRRIKFPAFVSLAGVPHGNVVRGITEGQQAGDQEKPLRKSSASCFQSVALQNQADGHLGAPFGVTP
ncbi:MAG: hypothetical protein QOJ99_2402 [Bryobacterales bacterium]|nr:hypothetical protein [Bryobacterales bacterium]